MLKVRKDGKEYSETSLIPYPVIQHSYASEELPDRCRKPEIQPLSSPPDSGEEFIDQSQLFTINYYEVFYLLCWHTERLERFKRISPIFEKDAVYI